MKTRVHMGDSAESKLASVENCSSEWVGCGVAWDMANYKADGVISAKAKFYSGVYMVLGDITPLPITILDEVHAWLALH